MYELDNLRLNDLSLNSILHCHRHSEPERCFRIQQAVFRFIHGTRRFTHDYQLDRSLPRSDHSPSSDMSSFHAYAPRYHYFSSLIFVTPTLSSLQIFFYQFSAITSWRLVDVLNFNFLYANGRQSQAVHRPVRPIAFCLFLFDFLCTYKYIYIAE